MTLWEPAYLELARTGELARRADTLYQRLESCDLCPRRCGALRTLGVTGFCRAGMAPVLSSACVHRGEEPILVGRTGVGNVFLGHCNLACVYCQNHQISQYPLEKGTTVEHLANTLLDLEGQGCATLGFVSPSHYVPQVVRSVEIAARRGLHHPLIWNSCAYDTVHVLREMEGITEIYLPDLRYADAGAAVRYSSAPDYPRVARAAIREMHRQVGSRLLLDDDGSVLRGLVIRLLVLPGGLSGTIESLRWIAEELGTGVTVSVMSQYFPTHHAARFPELARPITEAEYNEVLRAVDDLGFENGWIQGADARDFWKPDFTDTERPFRGT